MIPEMAWLMPMDLIDKVSKKHNVSRNWVAAMVWQESKGLSSAIRYEPHYKYLWFPRVWAERHNITLETEEILQKTSYGLMQIMGSTARELGYEGMLSELANDPELSLDLSVRYFKKKLEKYGSYELAIAAYNAGSVRYKKDGVTLINERYRDSVASNYREIVKYDK